MTQNVENTLNDFETARQLALSYLEENDDQSLLDALLAVWNTCTIDSFNRILLLMEAVGDPRFDEYGAADALAILRDLEPTDDLSQDVETFLSSMKEGDEAALVAAEKEAAEAANPFRQAAERLLMKFKSPNIEQTLYELSHL